MKMKLTQKETTLLKDLKASEELCIEKYGTYAERAENPELKQLFETIRGHELKHLQTIESLMQGTVPMIGGGNQQQQQNQQSGSPCCDECDRKMSKNDEYLVRDALDTEKHVSSVYDTCIFEFTDAGARDALNHIQKEEQQHGKQLYDYMSCHGMCA
ncbi:MAG: ferritin-like domain-containing protein [Clostridia bacterium]|nr:ferritin-like domain-containing protein [Clostridia bacterium]